jgi:predicted TIM-barrel enzyme
MIRSANNLDMLTSPYVFNLEDTKKMVKAGADIIIAHMGLTSSGKVGANTAITLEESARRIQKIADVAKEINPEIIILCHGGPIFKHKDVEYVFANSVNIEGFFGVSTHRGYTCNCLN